MAASALGYRNSRKILPARCRATAAPGTQKSVTVCRLVHIRRENGQQRLACVMLPGSTNIIMPASNSFFTKTNICAKQRARNCCWSKHGIIAPWGWCVRIVKSYLKPIHGRPIEVDEEGKSVFVAEPPWLSFGSRPSIILTLFPHTFGCVVSSEVRVDIKGSTAKMAYLLMPVGYCNRPLRVGGSQSLLCSARVHESH